MRSQHPAFSRPHPLPVFSVAPGLPTSLTSAQPETSSHLLQRTNLLCFGAGERCIWPCDQPSSFKLRPQLHFHKRAANLSFWGFYKSKLSWSSVLSSAGLDFSSQSLTNLCACLHYGFQRLHCGLLSQFPVLVGHASLGALSGVLWDVRKPVKVNGRFNLPSLLKSLLRF